MEIHARIASEYELLGRGAAWMGPLDVGVLEIRGEDRLGWLQGQFTNDVSHLPETGAVRGCFCKPTGQILAVCGLWWTPDRVLLLTDASRIPAVIDRLESMVVAEDVSFEVRSPSLVVYSVQGREAQLGVSNPKKEVEYVLAHDRTGFGGFDALLKKEGEFTFQSALPRLLPETANAARLEAGIPVADQDYGPRTLPPELGEAFLAETVSFTKGCFTGQEVLARMKSRGHANWRWIGLMAASEIEVASVVVDQESNEIGKVTSAAWSPRIGHIAGALVRLGALQPGLGVKVVTNNGILDCDIAPMPFAVA